jgi:hypothetical protein
MASKKTYTREFKEEAVSLANKMGMSVRQPVVWVYTTVFFGSGRRNWRITRRKPFRVRAIAMMKNYGSYSGRING